MSNPAKDDRQRSHTSQPKIDHEESIMKSKHKQEVEEIKSEPFIINSND